MKISYLFGYITVASACFTIACGPDPLVYDNHGNVRHSVSSQEVRQAELPEIQLDPLEPGIQLIPIVGDERDLRLVTIMGVAVGITKDSQPLETLQEYKGGNEVCSQREDEDPTPDPL